MSEREPPRLRDDPAAPHALRVDLARAAARPPIAYDAAAGLARFEQARAALPTASGAGAGGGGTILGAALKGALVGVLMVGGAALVESRSPPAPVVAGPSLPPPSLATAGPLRPVAPVPPVAAPPVAPAPRGPGKPPSPMEAAPGQDVAPRPAVLSAAPAPAASADAPAADAPAADSPAPAAQPAVSDALAAELALMARLRALEGPDPAQAIALAAEGGRQFPAGLFVQEREAIAIGALARVGRVPEARARAAAFLAAYPRSAFAERIRRMNEIGGGP